jgi:hypothetical protein
MFIKKKCYSNKSLLLLKQKCSFILNLNLVSYLENKKNFIVLIKNFSKSQMYITHAHYLHPIMVIL